MSNYIDLSVLLEDDKPVQCTVACSSIVAIQEDPDNKTRSFILLSSGHDMHIDLDFDSLRKLIRDN
jgi:hypothetical protein